ncbi:MAG TPA: TIM barrel protein [Gemmatimonadales bacterium]|nr:TIM barrel protein [Gemmatimonadales bacterium]
MNRRNAISALAGAASLLGMGTSEAETRVPRRRIQPAGRLKQSVSYWPYSKIPLPEFAKAAKGMGLAAVDLLQPEEWPVVRDAGLVCSMGYPTKRNDFLTSGFNDPSKHDMLVDELERTIPLAAAAKVPNVIAMFGNRKGRDDAEGAANCIIGLRRIAASAERHGVTVCVELLNSKVDHKDYMGDHTAFGVKVMEGVGSPRVKLLYDIYHMQIMEGDIIRTIRDNESHLGHFHTGGVPGRHELDDTQELNWRTVCKAIADTGYQGYVAHEFVPSRDPLTSLKEAVTLCDV